MKIKRLYIVITLIAIMIVMPNISASAYRYSATAQDSIFIEKVLKEASKKDKNTNLMLFFARKFIGLPYVAHTLEIFEDERLVVNTRQMDCTTLVENATALTYCAKQGKTSFHDFMYVLMQLRYKNGKMNKYPSRLHYFSEWIDNNSAMNYVYEIQSDKYPFTAIQTVKIDYMSKHPNAYTALKLHPEYVKEIKVNEDEVTGKKYRYIPKSNVKNNKTLRAMIHNGDILAITCNKDGLDIAHLGLAVWRTDGLHLLNASMIHKKVVEEPMTLYKYLKKHPSHTGIRVIRMK